jgi:hypothetical protein
MSDSSTGKTTVSCSLPSVMLLTIILLVLQYTVAPQLPWWLVWGPLMLFGTVLAGFIGFGLLLLAIGFIGAVFIGD